MDIRKLKYFIALAEELNFRKAAMRLHMSQPPLSVAIQQMEEELQVPLLVRSKNGVALTPAGVALYSRALNLVSQMENICATVSEIGAGIRGRLELSFVSGMALRRVPSLIAQFAQTHPALVVALREIPSAEQMDAILAGRVAGGFFHYSGIDRPEVDQVCISEEEFVCCVPRTHPLAGLKTIDLKAVADEAFILFTREASPVSYDKVIGICVSSGFSPRVSHSVVQWISAVMLVAAGLGIAIVPAIYRKLKWDDVRFIRIKNIHVRSSSYFVWQRQNNHAGLFEFVHLLRESSFVREGAK